MPRSIRINNVLGQGTNTYTYTANGRKLQAVIGDKTTYYVGNMIYENGSLKRILIDGGYIEGDAYYFYLTDHLGNNRVVANANGGIVQTTHYYPFGMSFAEGVSTSKQPYKYNGKELDTEKGLNLYDYSARLMDPVLGRFGTMDPLAEGSPWLTPYHYCSDNPINRVDVDGRWDVRVNVADGYGTAIVIDRKGNEVYRFKVRAEGVGGHNRMTQNSDTPYGIYDIPDNNAWTSGGSRVSYGRYARLVMTPESGEIVESGRDFIRIHGGRQEVYDPKTGRWAPVDDPKLKKTHGCLRAHDVDMKNFKKITDNLQKNDKKEIPGKVVVSELEEPVKTETIKGIQVDYHVPESTLVYWQYLINQILENK